MFESLYTFRLAMLRHRSAPLWPEREEFLRSLRQRGAPRHLLLHVANSLIYVVHYLHLSKLRPVASEEIQRAARIWLKNREPERLRTFSRSAIYNFVGRAKAFLKFHGQLIEKPKPPQPFLRELDLYVLFLAKEKGLSAETVEGRRWQVAHFLRWFSKRSTNLSTLTVVDIDAYLMEQWHEWKAVSIKGATVTLRSFCRYAKKRRWSCKVQPEGIEGPRVHYSRFAPAGPAWFDVWRLLRYEKRDKPGPMRARVLLLLFAIYGLRTSEATGLLVNDIDWKKKTFTVRRSKTYTIQQFPISPALETALRRYLKDGRPHCESEFLLVTHKWPFRRLDSGAVSQDIHLRMQSLGIQSVRYGPIALRHSCATRLLSKDMTLQEIADFLGHKDSLSVGIYAKHDLAALKKVARVDLCGAL